MSKWKEPKDLLEEIPPKLPRQSQLDAIMIRAVKVIIIPHIIESNKISINHWENL